MTDFNTLGLAAPILRALAEANHVNPTPIQSQAIPPVIAGRDLVGIAQTGTGKTAAFTLPILNRLAVHRSPARPERGAVRALVLAPTRELAGQILTAVKTYGKHLRLKTALAIGGVSMNPQVRALAQGVDVLVATPGRLMDLANHHAVRLDGVEVLVLDEADQMLDMGFIHAIRRIEALLPHARQSLLFSATWPKEIEALAAKMMRDPVRVAVTPVAKTADRIDQRILLVDKADKTAILADVLRREPVERALIFARTKHGADKIVRMLDKAGLPAAAIHGNKSQNQRERVLAAFRDGSLRTLVATDIAARGIDVAGVSHVVNFDLPNVPESYVHRIGRTARAGATGVAISLCDAEERPYLKAIECLIRSSIPAVDLRGRARSGTGTAAPKVDLPKREGESAAAPRAARRTADPASRPAANPASRTASKPAAKPVAGRAAGPASRQDTKSSHERGHTGGKAAQRPAAARTGTGRPAAREAGPDTGFAAMAFLKPARRPGRNTRFAPAARPVG
ncbi:DEAD/DEAH box helicase [Blastochloris tepida]|uniref:DEAD-box ATP-dependent RNA helicase RhpA n=1 Tax=Blastochloris tepida TaxID=2233851 RepID=A0A348FVR7_9HYPH|nr:RNA helicase [Blastochloris tepida]